MKTQKILINKKWWDLDSFVSSHRKSKQYNAKKHWLDCYKKLKDIDNAKKKA